MGVTPEFLRRLDELVRTDLRVLRDSYFEWLLILTGVVVIGILLEGPEVFWELHETCRRYRLSKHPVLPTPLPERHPPPWIIVLAFLGWFFVSAGIAGELAFEGFVSGADGLIQTFSNTLLVEAIDRASNAETGNLRLRKGLQMEIQRTAKAERATENEKLARVKIEKELEWRSLSDDQGREICKSLSPVSRVRVELSSIAGDAEAGQYASDFLRVLTACKWLAGPINGELMTGVLPQGVLYTLKLLTTPLRQYSSLPLKPPM